MKQFYTNYKNWECWQNGLYNDGVCDFKVNGSIKLLCDYGLFWDNMNEMYKKWPNTVKQHLTSSEINRRAFLGRATSCFYCGANIDCVRIAWASLTPLQQSEANECANKFVSFFENQYIETGQLSLFV